MNWWSNIKLEYEKINLSLICKFIFKCPSSIIQKDKKNNTSEGKGKYIFSYTPVSARYCSFKEKGITKDLLLTILAEIKRPLTSVGAYAKLKVGESVEQRVRSIIESSTLADPDFELIVFCEHSNMPDTEVIYYYIRNAFAHGSFEVKNMGNPIYKLESGNDGNIKAQIRIKESTLERYITLVEYTPAQIKELRNKQKRSKNKGLS